MSSTQAVCNVTYWVVFLFLIYSLHVSFSVCQSSVLEHSQMENSELAGGNFLRTPSSCRSKILGIIILCYTLAFGEVYTSSTLVLGKLWHSLMPRDGQIDRVNWFWCFALWRKHFSLKRHESIQVLLVSLTVTIICFSICSILTQ